MRPEPLDKNTKRRNYLLAALLAVIIIALVSLAFFYVSPEQAAGTDSLF